MKPTTYRLRYDAGRLLCKGAVGGPRPPWPLIGLAVASAGLIVAGVALILLGAFVADRVVAWVGAPITVLGLAYGAALMSALDSTNTGPDTSKEDAP